jgi:hypothetical protein
VSTEVRVFFGIGAFVVVIGVVYWFASYEDAGTTLLGAAAAFSLATGGWLWLRQRRPPPGDDHAAEEYFPHTSLWPFWIGVAGFFLANGLIVGSWFLVPGVILLLVGVVGYAAQSRSRA